MPSTHPTIGVVICCALVLVLLGLDMWGTLTGRSVYGRTRMEARRVDHLLVELRREITFFNLVDDWDFLDPDDFEYVDDSSAVIEQAVKDRDYPAAIDRATDALALLRTGQPADPIRRVSDRAA